MNWGRGIAITLILFMSFIIVLVTIMINTKVDLVTEDYYQKEMEFEDRIDESFNFESLENKPTISIDEENIHFILPTSMDYSDIQVSFFRPSDESLDKTIHIDKNESFSLKKKDFSSGNYTIQLSFTSQSEKYLLKKDVYL